MSAVRSVLAADSVDLFHRFKYVLVPGLAAWALLFVGTSLRCAFWDCSDVQSDKSGTVVTSHDVGLKMTLSTREPMPTLLLATHSFAALGLVIATLAQKEGVAAAARSETPLAKWRPRHRALGYAILVMLFFMDAAGYAMGRFSSFAHFDTFSVLFALPFAIWLVSIWVTAKAKWLQTHRLLSNMLLKGCIATPLARAGGALLQQFRPDLGIAFGYYGGIGAVTVLIGVWQMVELAAFAREGARARPVAGVLPAILGRRSVFPRSYVDREVTRAEVELLLEAAMWAPFHGSRPPWRFVVMGKAAMEKMQQLTLEFYDRNWQTTGWANGKRGTEEEYRKWRAMTEEEITGRWGPVSFMIAIAMRRQAGSKRIPEWEEAAATACAVQNMHIQAGASPGLACYWSSWHDAFRDSAEMKSFLGMEDEDRCLGLFIVAACDPALKDSRRRAPEAHNSVEWRD
jgi:nitroreductase